MAKGGKRGIEAGKAYVKAYWDDSAIVRGLKRTQNAVRGAGKAIGRAGLGLMGVAGTLAAPLAAATRVFTSFDDQMRTVKAVSGSTDAEFARLTETAKRLGATTSFTASDVAGLMAELGRAGFAANQIEEMTGAVLDMARATGTDATLSSGIMAATIRQFGLEASEATRVADAFTIAANKSFNSVESLGEAMAYAGPVAADLGMSLEETLAVFGSLGNVGIQGSNAGTAVRRLATLTAAEAAKFQEIFGVATADAAGNARPLIDVLSDINDATKDLGSADRAAKFNEAFGLLGITAASAIGKAGVSTRELLDDLENSGGAARKAAVEMDAGIGGSFRMMWSAVEGVAIGIGEALAPAISDIADHFTNVAGKVLAFITNNKTLVVTMAAAVPVVGALGAALVVLGTTFVWLAAVMGVIFSPAGVLIGGLALATAAVLKFTNTGAVIAEAFHGVFDPLIDSLKTVQAAIEAGDIEGAAKVMFAALKVIWAEGTTSLKSIWAESISWMSKLLVDATSGWGTLWAHMMMDFANMTGNQEMWQRWSDVHLQRGQAILDTKGTIDAMAGADIRRYQAELDTAKQALEKEVEAQDKKNAAAARGPAVEAPRPSGSSGGAADIPGMPEMPTLPQIDSRVKEAVAGAVNTATIANTSQAADALGKALGMGMAITDGDKMLGNKLDQINKSVKGLDGGSEGVI